MPPPSLLRRMPCRTPRLARILTMLVLAVAAAPVPADTLTSGWIDLGSGTLTPYYIRTTSVPGPVVMMTGGVHGNEPAGAAAANQIRTWSITRGTLVVVPFAAPQALAANTREIPGEGNLNRNFPGANDPITATTGPTATALWAFIRQQSPTWLLDMHEGFATYADNPDSVGASIIHMNESVTNTQVTRMLAAVNATIADPTKKFTDLGKSGPVDTGLARAAVEHLGTRGMIIETTTAEPVLAVRVNQHRTAANQFLMDQSMIAGAFGGPRNGVIDEFTFDEPDGTRLTAAGNSYPNGGAWNTSPFDTRTGAGVLRIQRTQSGTSTTSTGMLGAGEVRVRRAGETDNTLTDLGQGFATLVVNGWDFRSTQIGETISLGFRNTVSGTVEDTAQLVLQRTGADQVSILGVGFGTGSGTIAPTIRFKALQDVPVQFVLQLDKRTNLDGSALVSGASTGGYYRIFSQTLGQDFVEVGSGAAVRQTRNGNYLTMKISGSIGASGGFFDVDRIAFSSVLPGSLAPAGGVLGLTAASGTVVNQATLGYPLLSGTFGVAKLGAGMLVVNAANTLSGSLTVQAGRLQLANSAAWAVGRLVPLAGGTVTLSPGLKTTVGGLTPGAGGLVDVGSGMVTVASGLSPASLLAALATGRGDGSWNGTRGITSTAAAAALAQSIPRTIGWLDQGGGVISFAFAAPGDTNLDWSIDILDAANFLAGGKFDSSLAATWSEGDFGGDGIVDILDAADLISANLYDGGAYNGAVGTMAAVPEPAAAALAGVALACGAALARRRAGK